MVAIKKIENPGYLSQMKGEVSGVNLEKSFKLYNYHEFT